MPFLRDVPDEDECLRLSAPMLVQAIEVEGRVAGSRGTTPQNQYCAASVLSNILPTAMKQWQNTHVSSPDMRKSSCDYWYPHRSRKNMLTQWRHRRNCGYQWTLSMNYTDTYSLRCLKS